MFNQASYRTDSERATFTSMYQTVARAFLQCSEMQRRVDQYRKE